ncbi:hypothetical protein [Comamonas thiooxydans]|uniref:hypothetical protein n=1 Tax=Comamonas thiooxydans TaxID=363952 RepID=UPI000B236775|nr:hypothetical protein [Comamonas thiooxydans]
MGDVRRASFESLPLEERLKIATHGLSISAYANGNYAPVSSKQAENVERVARKSMSEFNLSLKRKMQAA